MTAIEAIARANWRPFLDRAVAWRLRVVCLLLVLVAAAILLPQLGHPFIIRWDESVHLGVMRNLYRTPFEPRLYADPLYPLPQRDPWTETGIFLHKPTLPFWLGALVMRLTGVTPLALRLVSATAATLTTLMTFCLARRLTAVRWAVLAALAFINLPFGWNLVQGYQFGDVTDCTLVACVALAMWLLLRAAETGAPRWFLLAGAVTGVGYLCKSTLALPPLGVAAVLWALAQTRLVPNRVTLRSLSLLVLTAAAVAAPWNLYCALRWPAEFQTEALHTANHLTGKGIEWWIRSGDALINEINESELNPLPVVLPLLAVLWLIWTAFKTRELAAVTCALWVGSEWIILSIARVKVPGTAWGAVPSVFAALALVCRDLWKRPALGLAVLGATQVPWLSASWPLLGHLRERLPAALGETHTRAGLAEGLLIVALALALGAVLARVRSRRVTAVSEVLVGSLAMASVLWLFLWHTAEARANSAKWNYEEHTLMSYGRDLAVLDRVVPRRSVFFLDFADDSSWSIESTSLLFWTDRMAYRCHQDERAAHAKDMHPYLVSTLAQPYLPLLQVPAGSWARAYDLEEPAEVAPLPDGVTRVGQRVGATEVLAFARAAGDAKRDRYVFFLRSHGPPTRLRVVFHGRRGDEERWLDPSASLETNDDLAKAAWFMVPTVAQRLEDVSAIEFAGGVRVPVGTGG